MKLRTQHDIHVELNPETVALLARLVSRESFKPPTAPRLPDPGHVLPLVQALYQRARAEDWKSSPSHKNTVDPDWYEPFHHLRVLLASLDAELLFPVDLTSSDVRVQSTLEQEGCSDAEIRRIVCPGLLCALTGTCIAPAQVQVNVPVERKEVAV